MTPDDDCPSCASPREERTPPRRPPPQTVPWTVAPTPRERVAWWCALVALAALLGYLCWRIGG